MILFFWKILVYRCHKLTQDINRKDNGVIRANQTATDMSR